MSGKGQGGNQKPDLRGSFTSSKYQQNISKRPTMTNESIAYSNSKKIACLFM